VKTYPVSQSLAALPFFAGMKEDQIEFLAGCASNVRFRRGDRIFRRDKPADTFLIVKSGRAAIDLFVGSQGVTLETVSENDLLGWSWLIPPYRWHFDVRAVTDVSAIAFDAECVRKKCATDPAFGYEMYKRFSAIIVERLMAARIQALKVYG
jgi:CRP/FNR family transcriptional regulator, cyclic AMP receptor protein